VSRLMRTTTIVAVGWLIQIVVTTGCGKHSQEKMTTEAEAGGKQHQVVKQEIGTEVAEADLEQQIANSIGMKLVLIPAGEFMMGNGEPAEATGRFLYGKDAPAPGMYNSEYPQHRVRITKRFYLGMYHVTREQFRQFVADTSYRTDAERNLGYRGACDWDAEKWEQITDEKYSWRYPGFQQGDEDPVVNVSWNDAVAFCKWLSRKEGKIYRLPTEAEWECACRAGTTTRYFSGDNPETLAKVGNIADATLKAKCAGLPNWRSTRWTIKASDGYVFTAPAGQFEPNAFGLCDMHGNAYQWCFDSFEDYDESPANDPTYPDAGELDWRVFRGSSWRSSSDDARSSRRGWFRSDTRTADLGFRVARAQ
jgi:formylglycine-generating enzyme